MLRESWKGTDTCECENRQGKYKFCRTQHQEHHTGAYPQGEFLLQGSLSLLFKIFELI